MNGLAQAEEIHGRKGNFLGLRHCQSHVIVFLKKDYLSGEPCGDKGGKKKGCSGVIQEFSFNLKPKGKVCQC